ncbi:MAG: 1-acyl-sn-glycerol-3-phosphate acyltransferase, partial [Lachnospiraceae bacterium]|nr:1-acyl-sn-glycerol-3-phosphate acyltransferase [Lachnospiraceae bacterium]
LYIGNHRSFFDVALTYIRVPRPTGYIAIKSMEKVPLLNIWMCNLHCLFLDRENIKAGMQTILAAIDLMKNGKSICIFPEGTRNKEEGTLLTFHEGSFKIAAKANCPIVPMTINNSAAVFENQFPWIKKAHVIIEYGKPIYIKELPKEQQKKLAPYVQSIMKRTTKTRRIYNKKPETLQFVKVSGLLFLPAYYCYLPLVHMFRYTL